MLRRALATEYLTTDRARSADSSSTGPPPAAANFSPHVAQRPRERMGRIRVVGQEYRTSGYISRKFIHRNSFGLTDNIEDALTISFTPSTYPHALALPREGTTSIPAWLGIQWLETDIVETLGMSNVHKAALVIITGTRANHSKSPDIYIGPLWWASWRVSDDGNIDVVGVKIDGSIHSLKPICDPSDTEIKVVSSSVAYLQRYTNWRLVRFQFEPM